MRSRQIAIATCCLLAGGLAIAGFKADAPVGLDIAGRSAYATMAGARNSPDGAQFMLCALQGTTSGLHGYCTVRDANGIQRRCTTTNQHLLEVIKSIKDTSHIYFTWDENDTCTRIEATFSSVYGPKL
ncbi:hypothetical protein MYSTI_05313 [Myxococcus stipitatus DSM 14675]|uniref:Lipoprotein n=1 Tax=Myxococcus stipitatus (strain DSM 14675 / JCM 12634 / Mx s8) TaxID=1278073 RepID=L7UEW1_MYXSD|nr:hypothetical protein MYSTI_05313 [Myxococcus stipitatus DSM 14675]